MQELSLNVLDIAQNSISAKASMIHISIIQSTPQNLLSISIEDNGIGMTEEQVKAVTDPFYTTRTTRKVGLGVPFFKMAAEQTGGNFIITSQKGVGTKVTANFVLNNIDRMPLGNISETMLTLITLNPAIDFIYTYTVNEKSFCMDTREFKQVLGDVPLNNPEVLEFISEFLSSNTETVDH